MTEVLSKAEIHSYSIVGAFHRANDTRDACPAVAILKILPVDTKLLLRPEPDNAVDPNAIAIWLSENDFPDLSEPQLKTFSGALANSGWTLDGVYALSEYKLGFIQAAIAAKIKLPSETPGRLTFDMSGKPKVSFQIGLEPTG